MTIKTDSEVLNDDDSGEQPIKSNPSEDGNDDTSDEQPIESDSSDGGYKS